MTPTQTYRAGLAARHDQMHAHLESRIRKLCTRGFTPAAILEVIMDETMTPADARKLPDPLLQLVCEAAFLAISETVGRIYEEAGMETAK